MATQKKKEEQETQNRPDAAYSTEGLNSRTDVERALAGAQYTPSERVQEAGAALKQWQESRPATTRAAIRERSTTCWVS